MNKLIIAELCLFWREPVLSAQLVWKFCYLLNFGVVRGVMDAVVGNRHGDTISNPGRNDCISHSANTLRKGMNPIIVLTAMFKM